jgi:cytochrome P450
MTGPGRRPGSVPGPRGTLLLGMARELRRDQLGALVGAMTAYGDVVRLAAGPPGRRTCFYLVTHPDGVQRVLAGRAGDYVKDTRFSREIAASLGDGLLTSNGRRWRQQRRTLAPVFTLRHVARYVPAMADEAVRLAHRWTTAAGAPARVELHAEMVEYTLRVVGRALFGASIDDAVPVIRATFPVVSEHVRRRAAAHGEDLVPLLLAAHELRSDPAPVALSTAITLRPATPVRCEVSLRQPAARSAAAATP